MAFQAGTQGRKVVAECGGQLMQPAVLGRMRKVSEAVGGEGKGVRVRCLALWRAFCSMACGRHNSCAIMVHAAGQACLPISKHWLPGRMLVLQAAVNACRAVWCYCVCV